MIKKNPLLIFSLILLLSIWSYSLFFIPTFDYDESLYRRLADEIKLSGQWWNPTLDRLPVWHKPPVLYWLMIFSSWIFDAAGSVLSSTSAKFPSFVFSLGIVVSLWRFSEYFLQRKLSTEEQWTPALLFMAATFPLATATSAIFDPLQTFLLLPALFIPIKYFMSDFDQNQQLSAREWFLFSLSLFLATAVKGLNGIIVPAFALVLHLTLIFYLRRDLRKCAVRFGFQFLAFAFLPAAIACGLWFLYLDEKMGRGFTREFFLIHHFGRSTEAMETHSGTFLYHPLVAWFGGGFLSVFLLLNALKKKIDYTREGFAFSFFAAFMVVFGFSATKLPHYTWPIWPALAILGSIYALKPVLPVQGWKDSRAIKFLCSLPIFFLGSAFLLLALSPLSFILSQIESVPARTVFSQFRGFPLNAQIFLWLGFAFCILYQSQRDFFVSRPIYTSLMGLATTLALSVSVMPVVVDLIHTPPTELAQMAATKYLKPGDCIRITGTHSPSISLALGHIYYHNRCEPDQATHLITAEWKLNECKEHGFNILEKRSHLYLCGKN